MYMTAEQYYDLVKDAIKEHPIKVTQYLRTKILLEAQQIIKTKGIKTQDEAIRIFEEQSEKWKKLCKIIKRNEGICCMNPESISMITKEVFKTI